MLLDHAHVRDARRVCRVQREDPDRAGADDDGEVRRDETPRQRDGVYRVRQRLDERARARVDAVGERDEVRDRHGHALGESSREVHTDEPPLGAEIPLPRATAGAGAAGEERIHAHATTGPLRTRTAWGGHHRPGELVPHDERRDAVGHPSEVALDLRAADPRRLRLDDDRIVAEARLVDLLDRHAPRTAPDERAHETAG